MPRPARTDQYGWTEPLIGVAMVAAATALLAVVVGAGALVAAWIF